MEEQRDSFPSSHGVGEHQGCHWPSCEVDRRVSTVELGAAVYESPNMRMLAPPINDSCDAYAPSTARSAEQLWATATLQHWVDAAAVVWWSWAGRRGASRVAGVKVIWFHVRLKRGEGYPFSDVDPSRQRINLGHAMQDVVDANC